MFFPDQAITRAEFAAIVVRGLGLNPSDTSTLFADVAASDWFSGTIHTAFAYSLISGFPDGTFRPADPITREQAMVIMAKAMEMTGLREKRIPRSVEETLQPFKDAHEVSYWARSGVAECIDAGIVVGKNGHILAPGAHITRAEAAVIMQRLLEQSGFIR